VANQVAIKVRKHGSAQRYTARVLAVGHEVGSCCYYNCLCTCFCFDVVAVLRC
jgi:hypothetical protein